MFDDDARRNELMGMLSAKNARRKNFKLRKEQEAREEKREMRKERRSHKQERIDRMKEVFENAERIFNQNKLNFKEGQEHKETVKNVDDEDVDLTIKFL
jgi:hypothetical protein